MNNNTKHLQEIRRRERRFWLSALALISAGVVFVDKVPENLPPHFQKSFPTVAYVLGFLSVVALSGKSHSIELSRKFLPKEGVPPDDDDYSQIPGN